MKKKIKDLTFREIVSIARKVNDSQENRFDTCDKCPFKDVKGIECWIYCIQTKEIRENIDNIINQEIEVEEDD